MRYDRPFILPEQAGDGEAQDASPPDAEPRKARLTGSVVVAAAAIAAGVGAWIWLDESTRAAHSAPGQTQDVVRAPEPAAAAEPAPEEQSEGHTPSRDDERVGPDASSPAPLVANWPSADEPTDVHRQAQIVEAVEQGQLHTTIGRHDVAAWHYAKAAELDPGNASVRYKLALAYVRSGQTAPARREMAALEELDPSLASLLGNLLR
jgi:Flp pilus assembly protein TadD